MEPEAKSEILDTLSDKISEGKAKSKIPTTNLEQNLIINSKSYSDLNQFFNPASGSQSEGGRVRSVTAGNLNTGSDQFFSSPPAPHGKLPTVYERNELPSVVTDMESDTLSKSGNKANIPMSDEDNSDNDNSDKDSFMRSRFKNLFNKRRNN